MKKLLFLALLAFTSCSKDDESLRANFAGRDLVKSATKIEKKYDATKGQFQIFLYTSDSIATLYEYYFQLNVGSVYSVDLRVNHKKYSLYEQTTGRLTKENNKVNGTLYTNKFGGAIEFKNYQL